MFEAKEKPIEGPGTIVGANVQLSGTLKDINDIVIHGKVDGEVASEKNVIVAKTAYVKGPIKAKNVQVAGKVNGEIHAHDKLEIIESGEVTGSIITNDLIIKSGAKLNGKCKMGQEEAKKEEMQKKENIKPAVKKEEINKEAQPVKNLTHKKYELE